MKAAGCALSEGKCRNKETSRHQDYCSSKEGKDPVEGRTAMELTECLQGVSCTEKGVN